MTVTFPDNDQLKEDIINSLDGLKRTAIAFSITSASQSMIEMMVEELDNRIKWCALISAVGGANPIPGLSAPVDMLLIKRESDFQKKQLLIDTEMMKKHEKTYGQEFTDKLNNVLSKESRPFLLGVTDEILSRIVITEIIENSAKAYPIIGSIIGASVSCTTTFLMLKQILKGNKEIALRCLDVMNKMDIEEKLNKKQM